MVSVGGLGSGPTNADRADTAGGPSAASKPYPIDPSPAEFARDLGVPLEDAGGGLPGLEALGISIKSSGERANMPLNAVVWDSAVKKLVVYYVAELPIIFQEEISKRASAAGYAILWRTAELLKSQALAVQARIDAARQSLARQGMQVGITGISVGWDSVRVDLMDGTKGQAQFIEQLYGPGVHVNWMAVPTPYEAGRSSDWAPWGGGLHRWIPSKSETVLLGLPSRRM